jgi:hypothetical protein
MKNKSNIVFRIDIPDFESKDEILVSIKKILELTDNKEFIDSFLTNHKNGLEVKLNGGISFIISDCDCE